MKSTFLSLVLASLVLTGCGLKQEQKDKVSELVKQGKTEIAQLKVSDSVFTSYNFDLNEEFADDLLSQSISNMSKAIDAFGSGSSSGIIDNSINEKLDRQNNLNTMQQNYITKVGELLGTYYLEILGVVKGSPIENNNEALKYTIYKQIPKDWHEITEEYVSIQDTALADAFSKVAKTSLVRDKINENVDIALKFLDQVDAKVK
jgi:hypothetical protein